LFALHDDICGEDLPTRGFDTAVGNSIRQPAELDGATRKLFKGMYNP
jgi:hypothetical protein